ncbi:hypothetical protein BDY21DRAFT_346610 [Lineolata rhizophorae]|uniref:Uncharacterized protein n=1 Tax=Lineolata rhizophorae TaxID=578093 RepID=A0A6A6NZ34_9PEZI|nr:hypothetical protein BDY21DRAFT_346610 [Lineolata rhizophorae]
MAASEVHLCGWSFAYFVVIREGRRPPRNEIQRPRTISSAIVILLGHQDRRRVGLCTVPEGERCGALQRHSFTSSHTGTGMYGRPLRPLPRPWRAREAAHPRSAAGKSPLHPYDGFRSHRRSAQRAASKSKMLLTGVDISVVHGEEAEERERENRFLVEPRPPQAT